MVLGEKIHTKDILLCNLIHLTKICFEVKRTIYSQRYYMDECLAHAPNEMPKCTHTSDTQPLA